MLTFMSFMFLYYPVIIYLFKVTNRNTGKRCEICSRLTIKTLQRVIDVVLVFLLLTLNIFPALFYCFYLWLWASKCELGNKMFSKKKKKHMPFSVTLLRLAAFIGIFKEVVIFSGNTTTDKLFKCMVEVIIATL